MVINIEVGIGKVLARKKKPRPITQNHCSSLDDKCLRRLFYRRTAWEKGTAVSNGLAGVWATGEKLEPVIENIINEVGMESEPKWRIVGKQAASDDKLFREHEITGTIDGMLQVYIDDKWVTLGVADIKTMSGNIFPGINCYADLDKYPWTKKYKGQLQLYSLCHNFGMCFIIAVSKQNLYDIKIIDFPVDMEYCDGLLGTAKAVNIAVKANTPPPKRNHPDDCEDCQFAAECCPEYATGGAISIEVCEELEQVMDDIDNLSVEQKEIKSLVKRRDFLLVKGKDIIIGRHTITWKQASNDTWRKKIIST